MLNELADILGTLHDGGITDYNGDFKKLELIIRCDYLAEIEKKDAKHFFLSVEDIQKFEFHYWGGKIVNDIEKIIDLELEIGYSEIKNDTIVVSCNTWESGGELFIKAKNPVLKNEDGITISTKKLYSMAKEYWNSKTKKRN